MNQDRTTLFCRDLATSVAPPPNICRLLEKVMVQVLMASPVKATTFADWLIMLSMQVNMLSLGFFSAFAPKIPKGFSKKLAMP